MKYRVFLSTFLLAFVIITATFGEQVKPRIAVIPFSAINVSESNAQTVTGLFETALVKTGAYTVFEQTQIAEVLATQKISLSGLADKKYAIELGKLLSAEQIILGDLSLLGGKYILNVKIIDVELGSNIKADSVETSKLSEMSAAAELLAFKLAGLTYTKGSSVQIANTFRDVFIETNPTGADIYINGVKKGLSPGLFEKVPLGNVIIEAKKDNLYGQTQSRITGDTNSINICLKETYGNLLIKSTVKDIGVYLDNNYIGQLGSGFFPDIVVGEHALVLDGNYYHWEGNVSIEVNKSVTVEAEPKPFGVIKYTLSGGVVGNLSDLSGISIDLDGSGNVPLPAGNYTVKLSGEGYEPEELAITISKGDTYGLYPVLNHNKEYVLSDFTESVETYSNLIRGSELITSDNILSLKSLQKELKESRFTFNDLEKKVGILIGQYTSKKAEQDEALRLANIRQGKINRLSEIKQRRKQINYRIKEYNRISRNKNIWGWSSAGVSVVSTALFGVFTYLSNVAYAGYEAATITEDAVAYKNEFQTYDTVSYISLGAGLVSAGVSVYLFLSKPSTESLSIEYAALGIEMAHLQGELQ